MAQTVLFVTHVFYYVLFSSLRTGISQVCQSKLVCFVEHVCCVHFVVLYYVCLKVFVQMEWDALQLKQNVFVLILLLSKSYTCVHCTNAYTLLHVQDVGIQIAIVLQCFHK